MVLNNRCVFGVILIFFLFVVFRFCFKVIAIFLLIFLKFRFRRDGVGLVDSLVIFIFFIWVIFSILMLVEFFFVFGKDFRKC